MRDILCLRSRSRLESVSQLSGATNAAKWRMPVSENPRAPLVVDDPRRDRGDQN